MSNVALLFLSDPPLNRVFQPISFSKVAGPGLRLGWISCNSVFQDRFLRLGETTTQVPCNISQAMMASYLSPENWGLGGWLRWCFAVRLEYQRKRDFFLDNLGSNIGHELVSTTPAGGGMFQCRPAPALYVFHAAARLTHSSYL